MLSPGNPPKFVELYVYDIDNEVANRIHALDPNDNTEGDLDPDIVGNLIDMLYECNPLVKQFSIARYRLVGYEDDRIAIRIVAPNDGDGPQFDLPSVDQLASLLVTDFLVETPSCDIVVHDKACGLHQSSSLYPAFMVLQYPLLFSDGDRGFQLDVFIVALT